MAARRLRRRVADVQDRSRMAWQGAGSVLVFALAASAVPAHAGEWDIEPQFRLSQTWSDNYRFSARDPEEEWISEIAPGVRISGEGRRANLELAYRMQTLMYAHNEDRNRTNHLLNANGGVELVREKLFFTADATSDIRSDGGLAASASNIVASDELDTVTTFSAGPRFQSRLSSAAAFEASLRREYVDFGSRDRGDSEADVVTAGLTSGPMFTTWGWSVDYSRRDESVARDSTGGGQSGFDEETKLERLRGELNLRASAATQLFVAGGTERNEFETAQAGDPVDGDFWEAGFRWNPSRTVSLEAATGERFFGETSRGSLSIRGSALNLQLGYSETVTTAPQLQFEQRFEPQFDQGVFTGDFDVELVPTVVDEVIVQERANARLVWEHSHTTASLSFIATDREYQRTGTTEQTRQSDLDVSWARLPRTTISGGIGFVEREVVTGGNAVVDETTSLRVGAVRRLSAQSDAELEMEHRSRARGADSNRITGALNLRF